MSTPIQWTDETWNPGRGCNRVSPGCDNCYAMKVAYRFAGPGLAYEGLATLRKGKADWTGIVREIPDTLDAPLHWRKPRRIFVNSQTDLFHHGYSNEFIAAVFGVMAACPQHTFQVLTKRAERMAEWFAWIGNAGWAERRCHSEAAQALDPLGVPKPLDCTWPLSNVQIGVSAEDQQRWDERKSFVHKVPAAVHFVSLEPLLGPIDLKATGRIHLSWVIVGGESGTGARPCDVTWIRSIIEQCAESAIPCFNKQLGSVWAREHGFHRLEADAAPKGGAWDVWPSELRVRQFPEART